MDDDFFSKSNLDLLHSEMTYALDILGKITRENESLKLDLLELYKNIEHIKEFVTKQNMKQLPIL